MDIVKHTARTPLCKQERLISDQIDFYVATKYVPTEVKLLSLDQPGECSTRKKHRLSSTLKKKQRPPFVVEVPEEAESIPKVNKFCLDEFQNKELIPLVEDQKQPAKAENPQPFQALPLLNTVKKESTLCVNHKYAIAH